MNEHDLAASKLKSFRPQDRADLQAMCDRGLLTAGRLRESLEEAFPWRSPKEGDEEDDPEPVEEPPIPAYVAGGSRLVFRVPDDQLPLTFTLEGLLKVLNKV